MKDKKKRKKMKKKGKDGGKAEDAVPAPIRPTASVSTDGGDRLRSEAHVADSARSSDAYKLTDPGHRLSTATDQQEPQYDYSPHSTPSPK